MHAIKSIFNIFQPILYKNETQHALKVRPLYIFILGLYLILLQSGH